jgi:GT2 family glycosyltransferase
MQETPKVFIVLVNWNAWGHTVECLESIFRSDYPNFQVIVVDNHSADDSLSKIAAWAAGDLAAPAAATELMQPYSAPPVSKPISCVSHSLEQSKDPHLDLLSQPLIFIQSGFNAGFGAGNNVAMSYIAQRGDADYVWLLNNDTVIAADALSAMVQTAQSAPGIVGSVVRNYFRPEKVQAYGGGYFSSLTASARLFSKPTRKPLNFIFGASFMLDRSTLEQLGLFDENIFMYFEEVEYCIRARERGILMSFSHANVFHKIGASSGDKHFQWLNLYRNRIYTMRKHFGHGPWIVFTALNWLINIVSPTTNGGKRRASREAFSFLWRDLRMVNKSRD